MAGRLAGCRDRGQRQRPCRLEHSRLQPGGMRQTKWRRSGRFADTESAHPGTGPDRSRLERKRARCRQLRPSRRDASGNRLLRGHKECRLPRHAHLRGDCRGRHAGQALEPACTQKGEHGSQRARRRWQDGQAPEMTGQARGARWLRQLGRCGPDRSARDWPSQLEPGAPQLPGARPVRLRSHEPEPACGGSGGAPSSAWSPHCECPGYRKCGGRREKRARGHKDGGRCPMRFPVALRMPGLCPSRLSGRNGGATGKTQPSGSLAENREHRYVHDALQTRIFRCHESPGGPYRQRLFQPAHTGWRRRLGNSPGSTYVPLDRDLRPARFDGPRLCGGLESRRHLGCGGFGFPLRRGSFPRLLRLDGRSLHQASQRGLGEFLIALAVLVRTEIRVLEPARNRDRLAAIMTGHGGLRRSPQHYRRKVIAFPAVIRRTGRLPLP